MVRRTKEGCLGGRLVKCRFLTYESTIVCAMGKSPKVPQTNIYVGLVGMNDVGMNDVYMVVIELYIEYNSQQCNIP